MLRRLVAFLAERRADDPLLTAITWYVVPHVNPDGEARNAAWSASTVPAIDHLGHEDRAYDLSLYMDHVVRERPGDDMEFGFPRDANDTGARPENLAVARFLAEGAPFHLHASFHGIAFASGPWFLIEEAWIDRTSGLREALRRRVRAMGYQPFDVDRGGEKGFRRIDEGFTTRPDSRSMVRWFEERNDPETAAKFRPSSMEYVRSLGGDPFTMVSEKVSILSKIFFVLACLLCYVSGQAIELGASSSPRPKLGDQELLRIFKNKKPINHRTVNASGVLQALRWAQLETTVRNAES